MLPRIALAIVLAVVGQCVDGNQRIIQVSCEELFTKDDDFFSSGSSDGGDLKCCVYENYSCNSLDDALHNLTSSSNVLINITTDVMLSFIAPVHYVENISIIGHNNPTVHCRSSGGIHFTYCNNCVIQDITWNGCGTKSTDAATQPGIKFTYSSNVTIQNCSFEHSVGPAVVLSEVSGEVNITQCEFKNNTHYRGHGAVLYYSPNNAANSSSLLFSISNCNFINNKHAKSLVYLGKINSKHNGTITLYNSKFYYNQGVLIYIVNENLYLHGKVLFLENTAKDGTGFFISNYSSVIFGENSNVLFAENSAISYMYGGAIFLRDHSNVIFDQNAKVYFINNHANTGTIYSMTSSNISFKGNSLTVFSDNIANVGGAIYCDSTSIISFEETSTVSFSNNTANDGGAIYCYSTSIISFKESSTVNFSNNIASYGQGGAIHRGRISFEDSSTVSFSNNIASYGGAINCHRISFEDSSTVSFSNNIASYGQGGAIHRGRISFEDSSTVSFSNNIASYGGAINCHRISFEDSSTVSFSNNSAKQHGGAMSIFGTISFKGNSFTTFTHNSANGGGAIYCYTLSFEESSTVNLSNNSAENGGAVFAHSNISFKESSTVSFSNNIATKYMGGAVHCYGTVSLRGNSTMFSDNSANDGGAIYCRIISFEESSTVNFSYNSAVRGGGAIICDIISFEGNSTTQFHYNIAEDGGAMYSRTVVTFKDNSNAIFNSNTAYYNGGGIYSHSTHLYFKNFSTVVFKNNIADYGGAVFAETHSNIIFSDNSAVKFNKNKALFDATIYSSNKSKITVKEDFSVTFDDIPAKWCFNICFPYNGHPDTVMIDSNSLVWCSNQEAFECLSNKCHCNDLKNSLSNSYYNPVININITDKLMILSSDIPLNHDGNVSIVGVNNLTILCVNGASLTLSIHGVLKIEGITWVRCGGGRPVINLVRVTSSVRIQRCSFQYSLASAIGYSLDIIIIGPRIFASNHMKFDISHCNFINNSHHRGQSYGAAIYFSWKYFKLTLELNNCNFINNGPDKSIIHFFNQDKTYSSVHINKCNFQNNQGVPVYISNHLSLHIGSETLFENNVAENGAGIYLSDNSTVVFDETSNAKFNNNYVELSGAGIFLYNHSNIIFAQGSVVKFNDNKAINGTIYSKTRSNVTFMATCEVTFNGNSATQYGAAIYSDENSHIVFTGNSNVSFNDNVIPFSDTQKQLGGTIFSETYGSVSFEGNSTTTFSSNTATFGAAIFSLYDCSIIFKDNSKAIFNDNVTQNLIKVNYNEAINGTIYSKASSNVTFMATCEVTFNGNSATQYGAAIYSVENSHVVFTGNSNVSFTNNVIPFSDTQKQLGGTIFSETYGSVSFEGNSTTMFISNTATFGAAIFSLCNSSIIFKGNSRSIFNGNLAQNCGALTSASFSSITFNDNAEVNYTANSALRANIFYESTAGAICTFERSHIAFLGNSFVRFIGNIADRGGAVVISESNIIIEKNSTLNFVNNTALYSAGGAFICSNNSNVTIKGNSNVLFNSNKANQNGGALHLYNKCKVIIQENSTAGFINNNAREDGGAIFCSQFSKFTFEGGIVATFHANMAENGGAVYFTNSDVTVNESSKIRFDNNEARQNGGIAYISVKSKVIFEGITTVIFYNNRALYSGGIFINNHSKIMFLGNSNISFVSNNATQDGGAGYLGSHCGFIVEENALLTFKDNSALRGGAIHMNYNITSLFAGNSTVLLYNNSAVIGGGAVSISNHASLTLKDHATVNFTDNSAQYGGAIYLDTTAHMINNSDKDCLSFRNNIAQFKGNEVYQDVADTCNSSCLNSTIFGINNELIDTPPYQLQFYNPAVCIDNDTDSQCSNYYIHNVMLGREIMLPACVLDYYNNEINDSTQFLVEDKIHQNYTIAGPTKILISCDTFRGLSITSYKVLTTSKNFSVNISLNVDHNSDWKQISVNLIVGLSPCHLGFWQYSRSEKCECYDAKSIVFCSSNGSTIKGGYWFGSVEGNPTVTLCPINYCNFTCCETVNGYYHLSPVRDNQCQSHRSGIACGSCTDGYTLSFDSTECVNVDSCSAGQTVLVTLLTVTYWIVMVTLVFVMMYYKVGIGYLYGITYYYSILDILLNQNLQTSRGLQLTVNIISSFSKITPQFLGELCLTTGMGGIDQQFIHYLHPLAIILILVAISLLAKRSRRISTFISRGIIHVICLLLLLSYTSVVSTSLLLIRSLTFHEIDKVYTYLSPDIEYFQGRHLAYGIVALLFIVSIVVGLPLLLTLEPILNRKFNFVKIKPLLDQFQGCYKDKYRCFAGYYMICRLVVITIVIVNSSNDFAVNYIVSAACGIIALLHLTVKPYNNKILNKFDGVILHLCGLTSALRLSDNFDSPFVIAITLVLVILPLLIFIAMALFLHKDDFKRMVAYFTSKHESPNSSNDASNNEVLMKEFHIVVDDSKRKNATICDV